MDFQFRDTLKRLLTSGDGGGDGVALKSMAHPAGIVGTPGVSGGTEGYGITLGLAADRTTTHWYDPSAEQHVLHVHNVGVVTMTREEAEDLGLKSKETIIEALKRKLGL